MTPELKEAIKKLKFLSEQIKGSPMKEAIDTVVEYCEQKTYTTEDIFGFIKWGFTKPGYMRNYFNYFHGDTKGFFTPSELLKKWEVWKLAQQRCNGGCCDNGTGYCMFCEKKLI